MVKKNLQNMDSVQNIIALFDTTLSRHLERLIGTRYGIGALPLNVITISLLTLLTEREKEIQSLASDGTERYTRETLLNELSAVNLYSIEGLATMLQDMLQKGYIDVDEHGRFSATKSSMSMGRLLGRVFPGMRGMNLFAYFVQTIDEVQSGRKDLDSANNYIDQILRMHGVSLTQQGLEPKPIKVPRPPVERKTKLGKIESPHISRTEPKIIASNGNLGHVEIRKLFTEQTELPEEPHIVPPDETEGSSVEPELSFKSSSQLLPEPISDTRNVFEEAAFDNIPLQTAPPVQEEPLHPPEPEEREADLTKDLDIESKQVKSLWKQITFQLTELSPVSEIVSEEHTPETADEIIAKRITAFEEDLAMQCPICKIAKIQIQKTATGKMYYRCSDKGCSFISWGKPYHVVCPQCGNQFLIEASDRYGKSILKCPRATCRYRQRPLGEIPAEGLEQTELTSNSPLTRKRVARRRVIRRRSTKGKKGLGTKRA